MNKGWEIKKLGDVCEVEYGTRVVNKRDGGTMYPVYGGGATFFMDTFNRENRLVVSRFAMSEQCTRFVSGKFFLNDSGLTLKPKDENILTCSFLNLQMLFLNDVIYSLGKGAAQRNLDVPTFRNLEIVYPKSLSEQHRIVSILDQCFSAIDKAKANAEQNLKNAREMFDCTLNSILYDKKWKIKKLGEVCEKVEYGTSSKSQSQGIMPVLRMGNIQNGRFVWDSLVYSNNEEDNKQYLLKYNDVLFNRTNSPELVGKTAIYKGERPAIFAGYLIRINRKENLLDADYLNYYLNSKMAFEYGKTVVISSVNQANINGTKLKTFPIPLPTLQDQQSIVRQLDTFRAETQKLEAIYQKKIDNFAELKKRILGKAFSGELNYNEKYL